jgi:hypothetical protein
MQVLPEKTTLACITFALTVERRRTFRAEFKKANGCKPTDSQVAQYLAEHSREIGDEARRIYRKDSGRADFSKFSPLIGLCVTGVMVELTQIRHQLSWVTACLFGAVGLLLGVFWAVDSSRR